jgi:myo-inositol catabolism protein IolC
MSLGFNKPLYILPFDHHELFQTQMFGWGGVATAEQIAQIASIKEVIYDGFKRAIALGVPAQRAGILVDEQFGAGILRDAAQRGYITACPAEKTGQEFFDFEYGEEFDAHIEAFRPTFVKVLVRYNPEDTSASNLQQLSRLKQLSDYLHVKSRSLFLFELLVPPLKSQLDHFNGDQGAYDAELRPQLMIQAVEQLQNAQIEPDIWKIEGFDRREQCEAVVGAVQRNGREQVGCIILGRGEGDAKVRSWLRAGATVPGCVGFAVGRTSFWEPLIALRQGKLNRDDAVAAIADRYRQFVDLFEEAACTTA